MENDMNFLENKSNENILQNNVQNNIEPVPMPAQVPTNIEPTPMPAQVPTNIEPTPVSEQVPANIEPTPMLAQIPTNIEPATLPMQVQENIDESAANNPVSETPTVQEEIEEKKEEGPKKSEEVLDEEAKLKLKKAKQKKQLLIIGASVLVVIVFSVWYIISNRKEEVKIYYDPNALLTEKQADSLIREKVEKIIDVYENKGKVFEVKSAAEEIIPQEDGESKENEEVDIAAPIKNAVEEDYVTITNYDTIVKELFTENGIKELESVKFNNKQFVVKEEGTTQLLKNIPDENKFSKSNVSLSMVKIKQAEITAQVTFTTYGLKDDILTYYVIIKNIKLVKNENNWLVDSFDYVNE